MSSYPEIVSPTSRVSLSEPFYQVQMRNLADIFREFFVSMLGAEEGWDNGNALTPGPSPAGRGATTRATEAGRSPCGILDSATRHGPSARPGQRQRHPHPRPLSRRERGQRQRQRRRAGLLADFDKLPSAGSGRMRQGLRDARATRLVNYSLQAFTAAR